MSKNCSKTKKCKCEVCLLNKYESLRGQLFLHQINEKSKSSTSHPRDLIKEATRKIKEVMVKSGMGPQSGSSSEDDDHEFEPSEDTEDTEESEDSEQSEGKDPLICTDNQIP